MRPLVVNTRSSGRIFTDREVKQTAGHVGVARQSRDIAFILRDFVRAN